MNQPCNIVNLLIRFVLLLSDNDHHSQAIVVTQNVLYTQAVSNMVHEGLVPIRDPALTCVDEVYIEEGIVVGVDKLGVFSVAPPLCWRADPRSLRVPSFICWKRLGMVVG